MYYQDYKQYVKTPYSDSETQIIKDYWGKCSAKEIALLTGRSIYSVRHKAKSMGIVKFRHLSLEEIETIRINASVLTAEEIGNIIGRKKNSICRVAASHGISLKKFGEDRSNSKLSNKDIDYIRELREEYGLTLLSIANKFEVHESTISRICSYKAR